MPPEEEEQTTHSQVQDRLSGTDTEEELDNLEVEEDDSEEDGDPFELSSGFLAGIEDEEQRALLEPYVKKWDAGVTRRFQELHSQYEPYKELGDPEALRVAHEVATMINNNPKMVYEILGKELGLADEQGLEAKEGPVSETAGNFPPELQSRLDQQQQMIETMATMLLGERQQEQQAAEDAALDSYLANLKAEFGDFDEQFVVTKMYHGASGEEAVKAYRQVIDSRVQEAMKATEGAPDLIGGGGAVTTEDTDVSKMNPNEVKSLVAGLMAQANPQGS